MDYDSPELRHRVWLHLQSRGALRPQARAADAFKGISLYSSGGKYTALRIGWLLTGIGFGFLLGFCINMLATYGDYSFRADENFMLLYSDRVGSIVYVASVCICGGIGLLMSYRAERKAEQPKEKKDEFEV